MNEPFEPVGEEEEYLANIEAENACLRATRYHLIEAGWQVATKLKAVMAECERLRAAGSRSNEEICQTLGQALGYPWFRDDQANFPGAVATDGVCVGDHVAESIAAEAAERIKSLTTERAAAISLLLSLARKQSVEADSSGWTWTTHYEIAGHVFPTEEAAREWIVEQIKPIPMRTVIKGTFTDVHMPRERE